MNKEIHEVVSYIKELMVINEKGRLCVNYPVHIFVGKYRCASFTIMPKYRGVYLPFRCLGYKIELIYNE